MALTINKPVVAHLRTSYLPGTVTFVYQYLINMKRYRPIMLAAFRTYPENFPFSELYIPPLSKVHQTLLRIEQRTLHSQRLILPYYYKVAKENHVSVLHAHNGNMGVYALPLSHRTGLPLVTTFYGADMSALPRKRPRWRRSYRRLFQSGQLFLVEGGHMRQGLIELGCPPEKIKIQRIGVDLNAFTYRPPPPIERFARILMVGRFTEKKGLEYGIRAFARALPSFPNSQLRIVGDGPLRPQLEQTIAQLGLKTDKRIQLLGYVNYEEYAEETARAHIFMAPSVTASDGDSEGGAPTVLLEMQARGVPVLATFHADIPEVVVDGYSGHLVPERNVEALADRLGQLLSHPETWEEMGRTGRKHMERQHDIVKLAQDLEAKYDRLWSN